MTGPDLGAALLILGFLATLVSLIALVVGDRLGPKNGETSTNVGYVAAMVATAVVTGATVLLTVAFLREDLTFAYVAQNRPNVVSPWAWIYQISGVWAGQEGSFLFWSWLLALFIAWAAWRRIRITDRLSNMALAVMNVVQGTFLALLMTAENSPFVRVVIQGTLAYDPATNRPLFDTATTFMSPLLQTWAMMLHPPTLFIGYAGLTVPFAYALAALIINDPSKKWVELSDRAAVFSWLLLGAGIGLGSVWAYYELAFGGYWAWDPVENASFLPWLTGVGMIHSYTVYRRRGTFKGWSIGLTAATFAMVILGTFVTRSGILSDASVHTFAGNRPALWILLSIIVASLVSTAGLYFWRRGSFATREDYEGVLTKEASYEFNNIIMLAMALLIAYMTLSSVFPAKLSFTPVPKTEVVDGVEQKRELSEIRADELKTVGIPLPAGRQLVGRETYEIIFRAIGVLYLLVMVICPVLSWRKTDGATFWRRVKWPLALSGVLSAGFLALWWFQFMPNWRRMLEVPGGTTIRPWEAYGEATLGLVVSAMAIALPLWLFFDGARKRSAAKGEGFAVALLNILTKARTQSGGYIVHLGMGIILLGLVGSGMFVDRVQANLPPTAGGTVKIQDYTFTLKEVTTGDRANGDLEIAAHFSSKRGSSARPGVSPAMILPMQMRSTTDDINRGRKEVALIHEPLRDVFVTFQSYGGEIVGMDIRVFPMISFTWGGFVVLMIGSALASWPRRAAAA